MCCARGAYAEPRGIRVELRVDGCPMLREEAYVAERLDRQLDEQEKRFLSGPSRNRYNAEKGGRKPRRYRLVHMDGRDG